MALILKATLMQLRVSDAGQNTARVSLQGETYRVYTTTKPIQIELLNWLVFNEKDYSISLVYTRFGKPEKRYSMKKSCKDQSNVNKLLDEAKIKPEYRVIFQDAISYIVNTVDYIKQMEKIEKRAKKKALKAAAAE